MKTSSLLFSLVLTVGFVSAAGAASAAIPVPTLPAKTTALFSQGAEYFTVKNDKNKTPVFRLLDKSPAEQALAMAVATALNQQAETDPKIPVQPYLDVKIDRLTLRPVKADPTKLEVTARVSGHELEVPKTISRAEFLAGKTIEMTFPPTVKDVSVFNLKSDAKLRVHLDVKSNEIVIDDANGAVAFSSPFLGDGSEKIKFKGRAPRETL